MKIFLALLISLSVSVGRADSWEGLVQRLTQTRADLETLSKESDSLQREKQADLDQWTQRKTEMEAQVQREKLRQMQIAEKLKRLESRVRVSGKSDPQAQKKLLGWISTFEKSVAQTIPFNLDNRLETLSRLKVRVNRDHEAMEFLLADFWSFVETELKLAQTNEYRIVDVEIAGKKRKCEVARLGLVALFVVTPEGKTLKAAHGATGWTWQDINSSSEQNSIISLVNNLKNKNDSGLYQLPMNESQMGASL
jgi:hypothetical protein